MFEYKYLCFGPSLLNGIQGVDRGLVNAWIYIVTTCVKKSFTVRLREWRQITIMIHVM